MVVDLREAKIFERKAAQRAYGLTYRGLTLADALKKLLKLLDVHSISPQLYCGSIP